MAVTKPSGTWTYDDLFALPDDGRRYEIIDGELYEMPAPNVVRAMVIMNLIAVLLPVVTERSGRLLTAPVDVFTGAANPVQPDLLVLLPDRLDLISARGIEGAPNLVIEVLSPSNSARDRLTKRDVYARGGVPEYWLASPEAASVEVLVRDGDLYRTHVRAGGDELVTSLVLPELSFSASSIFPDLIPD